MSNTSAHATEYQKYLDDELNISFLTPKDSVILRPETEQKIENPFLLNGKTYARIEQSENIAQIDSFQIEFDFNPADWLTAYAAFSGINKISVETVRSTENLVLGSLEYTTSGESGTPSIAYLAISGNRGYVVSGVGSNSNSLVTNIASSLTLVDSEWGKLDATKSTDFDGRSLDFRGDLSISNRSKGEAFVKILSNAPSIPDSSMLLILKTGVNRIHDANVRKFTSELSSLNFNYKIAKKREDEVVFELETSTGDSFIGFISTTKSGQSVSLITPSLLLDPNAWLSGKYYYIRTLLALK